MRESLGGLMDAQRVTKIIYGTVIMLVVILALEDGPPSPRGTVVRVLSAAFSLAMAELYVSFIGTRLSQKRSQSVSERHQIGKNVGAVTIGALLPLPLLVLAWIGVIRLDLAFTLDKWLLV